MKGLRLLNNGEWNKPPVLTAARQVLALGLANSFPQCTLGDSASFVNGTSYDVDRVSALASLPIIRISNLTDPNSAYIRTDEELGDKFWVRPGDLLVSWSASFKSALWAGPEGYLNQHIFKVTEKSGFDRRYIRHIIEASFDVMQERVVGIGMMHLRRADFLGHRVPSPPLSIQSAVAAYLDWIEGGRLGTEPTLPSELAEERRMVAHIEELAGQIQEARLLRQQAADAAQALIVSTYRSAFGESPQTNWISLSSLVTKIENGRSPQCESRPATGDEWGVLKVGAISFGTFNARENKALPIGLSFDPRHEVRQGDFLMSRANTTELVGACAIVNETRPRLLLSDKTFRFHFARDVAVLPRWLDHALKSPALRDQIERRASGTSPTMKNISKEKVLGLLLPAHSLSEQNSLVAELEKSQAQVDSLKRAQAETAVELDALLPAILDRAFSGRP